MKQVEDVSLDEPIITVVIPAYKVAAQIAAVLATIPHYVRHIVVVEDASPDSTHEIVTELAQKDPRIVLIRHASNRGVGGAMVTGFAQALAYGSQVVVKMDGDGQMNPDDLPALMAPIIHGQADFAKGNRFHDLRALADMPPLRRVGNVGLSFLAKAATGYWDCFDPTNGFLAIRGDLLAVLPLDQVHRSYFFEISLLGLLYLQRARVCDVPLPSRYGDEGSSLSISRTLWEFPPKLLFVFLRRIIFKYFLYDFSMCSIYWFAGTGLFLFGAVFGLVKWIKYVHLGLPAPTGTVMLAVLPVILGFQLLLSALGLDLQATPKEPRFSQPLGGQEAGILRDACDNDRRHEQGRE